MKRTKLQIVIVAATAAIGLVSPALAVQEPPAPLPQEKPEKSDRLQGKVEAVDTTAKTLTVGGKAIYVIDSTKITKDGKAITLGQITVGEQVHGTTRQTFDGKTEAITLKVGTQEKEKE